MAIHPTGAGTLLPPEQVAHLSLVSAVAHSIAIVSTLLLFLGGCGLARRMASPDRISFVAVVTLAFACVAVLIATAVSGFIIPDIWQHMILDVPAAARQWQIVIDAIFQINQAFSRIYAVGSSMAILLWSVAGLRNGGLHRAVALYGCVVAVLIAAAIAVGHVRLNVHAMAIVVGAHTIWFILVGWQLRSAAFETAK
jgi:hypothetical protein